MQAIDKPFPKIINGATQFVIPVFQRDYSWTEPQCIQLWKDIVAVGSRPKAAHFMGSVVYVPSGDISASFTRWLMIDGQQRVTTLTLLLLALKHHVRETGYVTDTDDGPTVKRIDAYFLRNVHEEGNREQKLVLRRRDQDTLSALLDESDLPAQPSNRIVENYELFRDLLRDSNPETVYRGIGRLVVVDVTLDRANDDPQLIFESLNSTGMDLTQADLIRNYILMRLPEQEQTRLYKEYWYKIELLFQDAGRRFDSFARDYMALKSQSTKQPRADEIYQTFRSFYEERSKELGDEALLDEMLRYARHYSAFMLGKGESALRPVLGRLARLAETSAVLVLRLLECHYELETLPLKELSEALDLLESYVFRRAICGAQTRGYWNRFSAIAYRLPDEGTLIRLKVELARQPSAYRFISDSDFRTELLQRPLYGMRICHFMLDRLENHDSKEPTDTSSYTVEHVLPQNENLPKDWRDALGPRWAELQAEWVHRLGNLTLTGYNATYSDRPFEVKKSIPGGFADSSVRLNKFVRDQDKWAVPQIKERGQMLADQALGIWGPLEVAREAILEVEREELKQAAARRTPDDVAMTTKCRELLALLQERMAALGEIIEKGETKSISYHADGTGRGEFFLEVLPRKNYLMLLLNIDYDEVSSLSERVNDATEQKFFFYAKYSGGSCITVGQEEHLDDVMVCVRRACELARQ